MTKTSIYLNQEKLALAENYSLKLTFALSALGNPSKLNEDRSGIFTIPGNDNNNRVFGHIFQPGIDCSFNPNIKAGARIEVDGLPLFEGIMKLVEIVKKDGQIEYKVQLFGRLANLFSALGDAQLTDLSLSEYAHTYNKTNQQSSWDSHIQMDGSDYDNFDANSDPTGEGYIYPLIDYGFDNNSKIFPADRLYPAIYAKQYIDKIFAYAGLSYESEFFSSPEFRRLIIPCDLSNWKLTHEEVEGRSFHVGLNADQEVSYILGTNTDDIVWNDLSGDFFDNTLGFDTLTGAFEAQESGKYVLRTKITPRLKFVVDPLQDAPLGHLPADLALRSSFAVLVNGVERQSFIRDIAYPLDTGTWLAGSTHFIDGEELDITLDNLYLSPGDEVSLVAKTIYDDTVFDPFYLSEERTDQVFLVITTDSNWQMTAAADIVYNAQVDPTKAIPRDVKMKDFLSSIFTMFNLHAELKDGVYHIEPRTDFYASAELKDWTYKLDLSKDIKLTPMSELTAKEYTFSYKQDTDKLNDNYRQLTGRVYGDAKVEIENDFAAKQVHSELIFAPAPLSSDGNSGRVLPSIIFLDKSGKVSVGKHLPRILYYGGLKTCQAFDYPDYADVNTETLTQYPFCGHTDDPLNPTLDISFHAPEFLFYGKNEVEVNYTNNNLFNKYHKSALDEITAKDAKLLTAFFHLTPKDISGLDFRDKVYVDGAYYRLNKIVDYDPLNPRTTKVELLTVTEVEPFVPATYPINTGTRPPRDNGYNGEPDPRIKWNAEISPEAVARPPLLGDYNEVYGDEDTFLIIGNNNLVGNATANIIIMGGSGNVVSGGLNNVVLINCSGLTITESNVTYINNIQQ